MHVLLLPKQAVCASNCPYSEVLLQSDAVVSSLLHCPDVQNIPLLSVLSMS